MGYYGYETVERWNFNGKYVSTAFLESYYIFTIIGK